MGLVPNKNARIIDGLAGVSIKETNRIEKLKEELFDEQGVPIEPKGMSDYHEKVNKQIEFSLLIQKRNILWMATLN